MKIYTGYFARLKLYKLCNLLPLSIAGKSPDWYDGDKFSLLAPKKDFFLKWKNEGLSNEWYIKQYKEKVLEKTSTGLVLSALSTISKVSNDKDIILLCWETPDKFCHRHLVADWLNKPMETYINFFFEGKVEEFNIDKYLK
jgi:hypothetical protein